MKWKQLFKPHILERGMEYYYAGCVEALEADDEQITAVVEGTEDFVAGGSLEDLLENTEDTFQQRLFKLIDERGMTDPDVYRAANIDRKLFSKIRNKEYQPSKPTALALCIALRLNRDEARDLLATAGYALSHSNVTDIIVEYFLSIKNYNIFEVNETLFYFDQPVL